MDTVLQWIGSHEVTLGILSAVSVLTFVGSLVAVPWLVVRMPADYFLHRRHFVDRWRSRHPLVRFALLILKNSCGVILVLTGIAMLVLPGQGILTIIVGLICLDFPGKFSLEQHFARIHPVIRTMNWIRHKAHRPPLEVRAEAAPRSIAE